jgi:hypothetical protein
MKNDDAWGLIVFVLSLAAFVAGGTVRGCLMEHQYRSEANQRGFAHYDAKTGEWKWNEPITKPTP